MMLSNRKYADPTEVLKSLVDDFGKQLLVGEQKDIGEFNMNLLERIEEGLGEELIFKNGANRGEKEDGKTIEEDYEVAESDSITKAL